MAEKQSNKDRIKDITAGIEQGIKELFESDRYRKYLTTMSRFHKYSLNNVMLIHSQRPDATLVAGFNKWKNSFGRHVKKGEKGIQILAPTPYKIKVEKEKLDPDTKLPMIDENGDPVTEEKEVNIFLGHSKSGGCNGSTLRLVDVCNLFCFRGKEGKLFLRFGKRLRA